MIIAIDCDLRESFCVSDTGRSGRGSTPFKALADMDGGLLVPPRPHTVLFEIASPVSFNRGAGGHAAMTQLARWAIWNVAHATSLSHFHTSRFIKFLVSPSNVWTQGYEEKTRHALAKATQKKKDLRECEAMLWFYAQRPQDWKPLSDYLESL